MPEVTCSVVSVVHQGGRIRVVPTQQELDGYFESLSNWRRWGPDDALGTLNHISAEKRKAAAAMISLGRTVSCARTITTGSEMDDVAGVAPQRYMLASGEGLASGSRGVGFAEYLGFVFHGFRITHLDALSHESWDGKLYNAVPAAAVTTQAGATRHDVVNARHGVFTRAVLIDIPRFRGVPWLQPGDAVTRQEVEDFLASTGTPIGPGDGLLLRTGYPALLSEQGAVDQQTAGRAGWHASCLPLFHEKDIAFIACDAAQDARPSGYDSLRNPIHLIGLVAMGLWLVDNCDFEDVAAQCQTLGTQAFAITFAPTPFSGATGSPVNPLALF
jgi:kynurenine formamidase